MKAYCINLDRRHDRLAHMAEQFNRLGVTFERVSAVDGSDPAVAAAAAGCGLGMTGLRMSAGAFGCFQSHREVWRRLLQSGESHAMVFEDDLLLAEGIATYLSPGWVPADADLVKLETFLTRLHRDRNPGIAAAGRRLYRLRSRHPGTGCYVVSAAAADRLLRQSAYISDPIDEVLFNERSALFESLVVYQMIPAPVVQGAAVQKNPLSWSTSSIPERFAADQTAPIPQSVGQVEVPFARLARRLREEVRGLVNGTRYVVVPFG